MLATRLLTGSMAAVLLTPTLLAAEVNRTWESLVATLKPGRSVVVVQHSRKQVEGKVTRITGASIALQVGEQTATIEREEVFRIRVAGTRSKRALIGLGAGAAEGVVFGANLGSRRHGTSAAAFGAIFGGVGAAGGAAIPVGAPLYEASGGWRGKQ